MAKRGREERWSYRRDPAVPAFPDDRPLIVFDGHCVLCSRWADFILRHDRRGRLRMAVTQSALGRALYAHYGLDPDETNLLITDGKAYARSDAVLGVLRQLGLPWSTATAAGVLPRGVRDRLYEVLARNRLKVFGRSETCHCPAPSDADRFIA